jgi:two-component system NtrC family sensor kinase
MRLAAKGTETENLFEMLANKSLVGVCIVQDGRFCYTNSTFQNITGYSEDELLGRDSLELIVPEDRERVRENTIEMLKGERILPYQFRATHRNGSIKWIMESVVTTRYSGRWATLMNLIDITERKQAEEALQAERNKLQSLIDAMSDAFNMIDTDYNVIYQNKLAKKLFGDRIGEKCYLAFEGNKNVCDGCPVKEAFKYGESHTAERKIVMPSGQVIFWENTANPIRDAEGSVVSCLELARDVTKRKQMEETLRNSEEKLRQIFESATDGISVIDLEGIITEANQRTVEMHGFSSKNELLGKSIFELLAPREQKRIATNLKKAIEEGAISGAEYTLLRADGSEFPGELSINILKDAQGNLFGHIAIARDITLQKQQNERLMSTDRLASVGELAAGTAHEFNNPLTSVMVLSQLLMEKEVPDDIREDLKLINKEAERAANVARNLLTFGGKHAPVKQLDQINSIIEDVLELRAYEHKANNIDVERHLGPDLPEIMVDYFQMQQVFMNIIINAEYFMTEAHGRGTLTITTEKENSTVRISIADDGPGILPEDLNRIFDPFFTTKEAGKGTGLGLSICHSIVTEHGGQIYGSSQLGKGATIFIELAIESRTHIKSLL